MRDNAVRSDITGLLAILSAMMDQWWRWRHNSGSASNHAHSFLSWTSFNMQSTTSFRKPLVPCCLSTTKDFA